jgi:Icc-related predicted phosphoesterase
MAASYPSVRASNPGQDVLVDPTHRTVRVAAAGDVHASEAHRERVETAFAEIDGEADLILLAGDVTTHGDPEEARVLADACEGLRTPVYAVLGNHDHHLGCGDEVADTLQAAGVLVLDRDWTVAEVDGLDVGIVGTKGFVGGFPGSFLPDFGEPLLREVYAETTAEAEAIAAGLQAVAHCPLRIVLLHYAPVDDTLEGEPLGIHAFLGCARLGIPIAEYLPDLVLHGHAHAGRFEGAIATTPVYNVAVQVTGRNFYVFELEATTGRSEVEVDAPPA